MTAFVLSSNPNTAFNPTSDTLVIDTGAASSLSIAPVGANVVVTDKSGHTATLQNMTIAQITTTNFNDTDGSQVLSGDNLVTTAGDDSANAIAGTANGDFVFGAGGNDTIDGGAKSDLIYGNVGVDSITGSAGNDTVFGGQDNDIINYNGAAPTDLNLIYGNLGDDNITSNAGTLYGGQGNDVMNINGGNGSLEHGNLGDDSIFGGSGNDTIWGDDGKDTINGFAGSDVIYGNVGDDVITSGASVGHDTVFGGQGADSVNYSGAGVATAAIIYGNLGADTLLGGAGNDTIFGGQDSDSITGGAGADTMSGNLGNDRFVIGATDSGVTTATADTITDFVTGSDLIVAGAGTYAEVANGTVTTVEQAAAVAMTAHYEFVAGATDGYLLIDTDANLANGPEEIIVLKGLNTLAGFAATDII